MDGNFNLFILFNNSNTLYVTHIDGSFFWQNSQPFHFVQIDSLLNRKSCPPFNFTMSNIERKRGSLWISLNADRTFRTCRMSYQIKGTFNFLKLVPILNKYGRFSRLFSQRSSIVSTPSWDDLEKTFSLSKAAVFNMIKLAYGQGSSFLPGPRKSPKDLDAAHGHPLSLINDSR